ncbi:DNA repair protein RecO [Ruminococcus sp.]|uniref:DNA repair protein RecO n=1 Tax=Ruminococcus sp. TaxID=41978 RepID=UPI0025EC0D64|nr:DNA repair protein RecO [Ruminococcus sp.]
METYRGLVLAQRTAGDRGKFIDILTEKNTLQEVYVRGAKKASASGTSTTQLFSYATFSVQQRQNRFYLDSTDPIRIFYRLRESLSRLSLAMYFSELLRQSVREYHNPGENCEVMRLALNTLHYLENGQREEGLLKPVFELRLMTELGMMPDLLMCRCCGKFLPKRLYFSVEEGCFSCQDCGAPKTAYAPILLRAPALQAMRHMIFADFSRLYNFRLGAENLAAVQLCAERFVRYHLDVRLDTLEFYHKITTPLQLMEETTHEPTSSDTGIS